MNRDLYKELQVLVSVVSIGICTRGLLFYKIREVDQ